MASGRRVLVSHTEKVRLRHLVEAVERETGAEIAALVVPHVDDLEAFATASFNRVGIGKRERHNGVLILVVADRRRVRIEVGRGLEDVITAEAAKAIIDDVMAPEFRSGRYGEGLLRGAAAVATLIRTAHHAARQGGTPAGER